MSQNPNISLQILTPEGVILAVDGVTSVTVPLVDGGTIGIKQNHGPLIAETTTGLLNYQTESGHKAIEVASGVLNIRDNIVQIFTAGQGTLSPKSQIKSTDLKFYRLMNTLESEINPQKTNQSEPLDNE